MKVFDWLISAASGLLGLLYWHVIDRIKRLELNESNHERLTRLESMMPSEFERAELTRQRLATSENIQRIFDALEDMRDRATHRHLEILDKIERKMDKP